MLRAVSFVLLNSLALGALIGVVILGAKYILDPGIRTYVGAPIVVALVFVYGIWVWTPFWRSGVNKRWT